VTAISTVIELSKELNRMDSAIESIPKQPAAGAEHRLKERHLATLDGVRGVAILLVLVHHFLQVADGDLYAVPRLLQYFQFGWVGVDLFFVLSGFLITGILVDSRGSETYFRSFYIRRALRIFPLYYSVLIVALGVVPLLRHTSASALYGMKMNPIWLWFYGSNLKAAFSFGTFTHFWSLAVEEQFYLVWPLIVLLCSDRLLLAVSMLFVVAALGFRLLLAAHGCSVVSMYVLTPCRFDDLAAGAIAAICVRNATLLPVAVRTAKAAAIVLGLAIAVYIFRSRGAAHFGYRLETLGFSVLCLFFTAVVLLASVAARGTVMHRILTAPALRISGRYSYGMYVFHYLLRPLFDRWFPVGRLGFGNLLLGWSLHILLAGTATLAIAMLSWFVLESRCLRYKKYFEYHKPAAPLGGFMQSA